jgi:anti-sigma regulatory factor (Ser/Thr protein kinase)
VTPGRIVLPADPTSAAAARSFTQRHLSGAGRQNVTDVGLLLVSELATNALRHAGTDFEVVISLTRRGVRICVGDDNPRRPGSPVVRPHHDAEGGRGLVLVEELADRWGVEGDPPGKVVWFELDCPVPA